MAYLSMQTAPMRWRLVRKGARIFGLLGKATRFGVGSFNRDDVGKNWAVTAEYGFVRLERFSGEEEILRDEIVLPSPFSYEYGITGQHACPEVIRSVFGVLSNELEQVVTVLRRGSFPVLGFSHGEQRCSLTGTIIPGYWPHVVTSNSALYGNLLSLETFIRVVVSSLPQGQLVQRYPMLQPIFKQMMRLSAFQRAGVPYTREMLEAAPAPGRMGIPAGTPA
jgi:hypothetical protein